MPQTMLTFNELLLGLRRMEKEVVADVLEHMEELETGGLDWEARWKVVKARLQQRLQDDEIVPLVKTGLQDG